MHLEGARLWQTWHELRNPLRQASRGTFRALSYKRTLKVANVTSAYCHWMRLHDPGNYQQKVYIDVGHVRRLVDRFVGALHPAMVSDYRRAEDNLLWGDSSRLSNCDLGFELEPIGSSGSSGGSRPSDSAANSAGALSFLTRATCLNPLVWHNRQRRARHPAGRHPGSCSCARRRPSSSCGELPQACTLCPRLGSPPASRTPQSSNARRPGHVVGLSS